MLPDLPSDQPVAGDPAFGEIRSLVVGFTGNFHLAERRSQLFQKVERRQASLGLDSLEAYLALLKRGGEGRDELDRLVTELTVGETSFFRHLEQFDALRDSILPDCLERNEHSRQLRIWSAGCANGAEAYSIAIVVHAVLGSRMADWNVAIVGSDINRAFLASAEAGCYSPWTCRDLDEAQVPLLFSQDGPCWRIRDQYKEHVAFRYHNLISDETPALHQNIFAFDIIFCRNVMIYFDSAANAALTESLARALVDGGYLFVAPADFHAHLPQVFVSEKVGGVSVLRKKPSFPTHGMRDAASSPNSGTAAVGRAAPRESARSPSSIPTSAGKKMNGRQSLSRRRPRPPSQEPASRPLPPPDIATIIKLANCGDWTNAARHCEAILDADSCNVAAHYYHGLVLQVTGARDEAERAWRRAIYLDRGFALAHYQLGIARKERRDVTGSSKAFRNAVDALEGMPDDQPVSPCDQITAFDLRELAAQQLTLLGGHERDA